MQKNYLEINEKYKYKIKINKPITEFKNVNNQIDKTISKIIREFIDSSKRRVQLNMYYTLYITYKSYKYNTFTTYVFSISEFTGGAHPNNYMKSIRFNNKGEIITIKNLIEQNSNILNTLSKISRKILFEKLSSNDNDVNLQMILDGTKHVKENFENFIFSDEGLIILFDYYQVTPYYLGVQKVLIPYKKLNIKF